MQTCCVGRNGSIEAGDVLVQLPTQKEWRQLQRLYEWKKLETTQALLKTTDVAIRNAKDRTKLTQRDREKKEAKSMLTKQSLKKPENLNASAAASDKAWLNIEPLTLDQFLLVSTPHPQIDLYLAAKDDGALQALTEWIEEFNEAKMDSFKRQFYQLPNEIRCQGQSEANAK